MLKRPLFIIGVVVAVAVGLNSIRPTDSGLKLPYGPAAEPVPLIGDYSNRRVMIAEAIAHGDEQRLESLEVGADEMAAAEDFLRASSSHQRVIAEGQVLLGKAFTSGYLDGSDIVILATEPATVPGAAVVVVPHSLAELESIAQSIRRQIRGRGLSATAQVEGRRELVVVSVCAAADTPLDLSSFPATAVDYRGECGHPNDPSDKL